MKIILKNCAALLVAGSLCGLCGCATIGDGAAGSSGEAWRNLAANFLGAKTAKKKILKPRGVLRAHTLADVMEADPADLQSFLVRKRAAIDFMKGNRELDEYARQNGVVFGESAGFAGIGGGGGLGSFAAGTVAGVVVQAARGAE